MLMSCSGLNNDTVYGDLRNCLGAGDQPPRLAVE